MHNKSSFLNKTIEFFKNKDQILSKLNFSLAILLACFPFITFLYSFLFQIEEHFPFLEWFILYICYLIIYVALNYKNLFKKKIKSKLEKWILWLSVIALCLVFITPIFNGVLTVNNLEFLWYVLVFLCLIKLKKDQLKIFVEILFFSLAFSCLLGIIDPLCLFMPGFHYGWQHSLFFYQQNYSSTIIAMAIIAISNILLREKNKLKISLYISYLVLMFLFMFLNGSFAGITSVFIIFVFEFIFLSVKNKKLNWKFILLFLGFATASFTVELYPNIQNIRTCEYNYFIECIAAFDNVFNTHILNIFGIDYVPGADGWDRRELLLNSLYTVFGGDSTNFFYRLSTFLFGLGGGTVHRLAPHNLFVSFWVDFGFVFAIIFMAIFILILIYQMKNTKIKPQIYPWFFASISFLLTTLVGCFIIYPFFYFVIFMAIGFNITQNSNKKEYRDLFDENRNPINEIIEKDEPIPAGKYYTTVIVFIQNLNGQFLLQQRSAQKGGQWATTGGHPKAGENSIEGLCSEIQEEIGLCVHENEPLLYKTIKTDNDFVDLYYLKKDVDINSLVMQKEEVQNIKWFSKEEIENMINNQTFFKWHIDPYRDCLKYLQKNKNK